MGIPRQNSRGMLSEAFAEAGGDGDPRSEGARPDSDRPGSTRSGSASRPPPSPLNPGQTATTTYGSAPTTPPGSYGQTTYGFGLGSLPGHNRQTTNGPGSLPVGSPSLPFVSSHVSSAGFGGSGGGAYGYLKVYKRRARMKPYVTLVGEMSGVAAPMPNLGTTTFSSPGGAQLHQVGGVVPSMAPPVAGAGGAYVPPVAFGEPGQQSTV